MKKKYIFLYLLIFQIVFVLFSGMFTSFIEKFYFELWYNKWSLFLRSIFGPVNTSVGDILYLFLFGYLIFFIKVKEKKINLKKTAFRGINIFSIFYLIFNISWGLNYYKTPLDKKLNIATTYSDEELFDFTQKLILKTNEIHKKITKNDSIKVVVPYTQDTILKMNVTGYEMLTKEISFIKYSKIAVKKSILSIPISYMGVGGYLNPFTNEAQINCNGPKYSFAMTANHEMAHQIGFASESEANFVGFLASKNNNNLYIQYSGYSYALKYCLKNWKIRDYTKFKKFIKTINPGIIKNYEESEKYWKNYDTVIAEIFSSFYDQFLKMNQQKDGLESYSKFIDLMVNYYKNRAL